MKRRLLFALLCLLLALAAPLHAQTLELRKGDHICIVGNTLAERMQHFGWLETLIVSRFPDKDLVFRNLAVSGDEITFRHRSESFGSVTMRDSIILPTKAATIAWARDLLVGRTL